MSTIAKALVAALTALVGALAVGAVDNGLTLGEWLTATSAGLAALGAVYGVRNGPPEPVGDSGHSEFEFLLLVLVAVGVLLLLLGIHFR